MTREERNLTDQACETVKKGFELSFVKPTSGRSRAANERGKGEGCKGDFDIPA